MFVTILNKAFRYISLLNLSKIQYQIIKDFPIKDTYTWECEFAN